VTTKALPLSLAESNLDGGALLRRKAHSMNTLTKHTILWMTALAVFGCANHREARRKSVQLYPGLPQREVVSLYGTPNRAEGNPDEGTCLVTTMSVGRDPEANPISNTGQRMNWCGSMKTST
jgi:hypothetical protein